jgi:hypothetical protein
MLVIAEILILAGVLGLLRAVWKAVRNVPRCNDDFIFF